MMKFLFMFFISINCFANYDRYEYTDKKKDPQLEYTLESPEVNRTTPESSFYYLKSGFSVGSVNGEPDDFTFGALGTRRYADEFYYGFEYSTHTNSSKLKTSMFNVQFGHHFLTWRHSVKPYIGGSFGYSTLEGKGSNEYDAAGVAMGLDLGFQIYKSGPFRVNTGVNIHNVNFNKKEIKDSNFRDMYIMFGVGF